MQRLRFIPAIGILCAIASAQNYTVSPSAYTSAEGNTGNTIPWWSATHRYQQIHNDVRGNAWLIQGLSLRRDGPGTFATAIARTVDAEIFAGTADFDTAAANFANNYLTGPTTVVNRKMINLPDFTNSLGSPAPWSIVIPFDTPLAYSGTQDLVWDILIHATTSTGGYFCDAYNGSVAATNTTLGPGCTATGKTTAMSLSASLASAPNTFRFGWSGSNYPNNAVAFVVVGTSNPNLTVPGLCTVLRAFPLFFFVGLSSATGTLSIPATGVPWDPAFVGATLFSQAFADDPGQSGIPLAGSPGVQSMINAPPPFKIARIWVDNVTSPTGSRSEATPYGLVTRFTHQ
jgi:hypothetical protein